MLNRDQTIMLPRLPNAWANCGRALLSLRHRLFGKTRESEQRVAAQHSPDLATKRLGDHPFALTNLEEIPVYAELIRTQAQLMETMLQALVLARGEKVHGSAKQSDLNPKS